jgi:hypothetical protein
MPRRNWTALVVAHTPVGWTVKHPNSYDASRAGRCIFRSKTILCPVVSDLYTLQVFLHEVAHATFHTYDKRNNCVCEYEAEMWAINEMRRMGFTVPRSIWYNAKLNVALRIEEDKKKGFKIPTKLMAWTQRVRKHTDGYKAKEAMRDPGLYS